MLTSIVLINRCEHHHLLVVTDQRRYKMAVELWTPIKRHFVDEMRGLSLTDYHTNQSLIVTGVYNHLSSHQNP